MTVLHQGQDLLSGHSRPRLLCLSNLEYHDIPDDPVPAWAAFGSDVNGEMCIGGH